MVPGNTDSQVSVPGKKSSSYDYGTCLRVTVLMYEVCEQFLGACDMGAHV